MAVSRLPKYRSGCCPDLITLLIRLIILIPNGVRARLRTLSCSWYIYLIAQSVQEVFSPCQLIHELTMTKAKYIEALRAIPKETFLVKSSTLSILFALIPVWPFSDPIPPESFQCARRKGEDLGQEGGLQFRSGLWG